MTGSAASSRKWYPCRQWQKEQVWLFFKPISAHENGGKNGWDKIDASLAPCRMQMRDVLQLLSIVAAEEIAIAKKSSTVRLWFLKAANWILLMEAELGNGKRQTVSSRSLAHQSNNFADEGTVQPSPPAVKPQPTGGALFRFFNLSCTRSRSFVAQGPLAHEQKIGPVVSSGSWVLFFFC